MKKTLTTLLLLLALLIPLNGQAAPGWEPIPPAHVTSLVAIELTGSADHARLADMGLQYYAQLTGPQGAVLLLAADGKQRIRVAQQGYAVRVLDVDISAAEYFLLYGTPEELARLSAADGVLYQAGRQALLRGDALSAARLDRLALRYARLTLQPLNRSALSEAMPQAALAPQAASAVVADMLAQVQQPALEQRLAELSGEIGVTIGGSPYYINTRYSMAQAPIQYATQYTYEYFQGLGLPVSYHNYIMPASSGRELRNVIAEQPGKGQPERIVVLTAHMDSTSTLPYQNAPGADDNASGSVAVMEAARILRQYDFDCTLRYALFTGEEQGLYGSAAYAGDAKQAGDDIEAVLNLDMLAYNSTGTAPTLELHTRPTNNGDLAIANLFIQAISDYSLDLTPLLLRDGMRASDHAEFWDNGYAAILAIEDWADHTPYYHRTGDTLDSLNLPYYTEMVKASLATFAHLGCLLDGQIDGQVTDAASGAPLAGAQVSAWQAGALVRSVVSAADGTYRLPLPAGSYSLRFSAADHQTSFQDNVSVVKDQIDQYNRALGACATVTAPAFSITPWLTKPGLPVAFSAWVAGGAAPISYSWSFGDGQSGSGAQTTHSYTQPGVYAILLTADNTCGLPLTISGNLVVAQHVLYAPLIRK